MSISSIARSSGLERVWSEGLTGGRVTVKTVSRRQVDTELEDGTYPFPNQEILYGEFEYKQPGRRGFNPTKTGEYQYRTESGLFLFRIPGQNPDPEQVLSELNKSQETEHQITRFRDFSRQSLWRFFSNANQFQSIQILGHSEDSESLIDSIRLQGGGTLDNSYLKELSQKYPVSSAKVTFSTPTSETPVIVKYRQGAFEMPGASESESEYVIQLFERDVVAPNS